MKHSCFNVCTYNHDGMVIYNTMTGAVIALNQYYSRIIVSHDITLLQQLDEVVRMEGTTFE